MQNTELPSSLPSAQTRQPCSEKTDGKDADATKLDKKTNLFPIMNYVQEKEQALLEGWLADRKNFEPILRLVIQTC